MAHIDFWYEFASTYSYPAAMCIEERAAKDSVEVRWRPFLLGPIFKAQGWDDSPFNIYEAKGRYMWRDMERTCANHEIGFARPAKFPQNGLLGARVATVFEGRERMLFSRALYTSEFALGRDIGEAETVADSIAAAGLDPPVTLAEAQTTQNRAALRAATEEAQARGVFGAPTFIVSDGEMFWGNDRLDDAIAWAVNLNGQ